MFLRISVHIGIGVHSIQNVCFIIFERWLLQEQLTKEQKKTLKLKWNVISNFVCFWYMQSSSYVVRSLHKMNEIVISEQQHGMKPKYLNTVLSSKLHRHKTKTRKCNVHTWLRVHIIAIYRIYKIHFDDSLLFSAAKLIECEAIASAQLRKMMRMFQIDWRKVLNCQDSISHSNIYYERYVRDFMESLNGCENVSKRWTPINIVE